MIRNENHVSWPQEIVISVWNEYTKYKVGSRPFDQAELDVGNTSITSRVYIVLSKTLPLDTKYLALSHCWGTSPICKLTTSSEGFFYEGIEVSKLSRTFSRCNICHQSLPKTVWSSLLVDRLAMHHSRFSPRLAVGVCGDGRGVSKCILHNHGDCI